MKLVVRVQYIGDRARLLLRDDLAAEYTKGLIDDLEYFGFPMPHEQKPIEKSGFMLCVWHVERDSVRTSSTPSSCASSPSSIGIRTYIILSKTLSSKQSLKRRYSSTGLCEPAVSQYPCLVLNP